MLEGGYLLFDYRNIRSEIFLIPVLLYIGGILTAVSSFNFINSTKATNVFLSMNIKRKTLLLNRFFSSAVYLFISVTVPFCINLFNTINALGYNPAILKAWLYMLFGMLACVYTAFSVTMFATVIAGNKFESCLYSVAFLSAPSVITIGVEWVMNKFLNGFICTFARAESLSSLYLDKGGLFLNTRVINPLFFFSNPNINAYNNGLINYSSYGEFNLKTLKINAAEYLPVLLWLLISAGFLFIAVRAFNRRKVENSGSNGACRPAAAFLSAIVMFGAFAVSVHNLPLKKLPTLIISIVISAVAYLVINAVVYRNKKDIVPALKKLPIGIGAVVVMSLILITGGLGYTNAVPDIDDVEVAYVTSPINDKMLFGGTRVSGWGSNNDGLTHITGYMEMTGGFTSENDIREILSLHESITEAELTDQEMDFCIIYRLKSGKTVRRGFRYLSDENIKQALSLANSDYCRDVVKTKFMATDKELDELYGVPGEKEAEEGDVFSVYKKDIWSKNYSKNRWIFKYTNANTYYLYNKNGEKSEKPLSDMLTEEDYTQFVGCLYEDFQKSNLSERYLPSKKVIGIISLSSEKEITHFEDVWFQNNSFNHFAVVITEDMKSTLKYLNNKDMIKYFDNTKEFAEVKIMPFSDAKTKVYNYTYEEKLGRLFCMEINAESDTNMVESNYKEDILKDYTRFTDKAKINELYDASYQFAYVEDEGYIAEYVFTDGSTVRLYIPSSYENLIKNY